MPIETRHAELGSVRLHYATAGTGTPIVLIHGWPQTWFAWRRLMPLLEDRFTLIAPDLRGLGDSSRPASGYDKMTVADDVWRLMHDELGHERFGVVGHDWGGGVAYALTASHRDAVDKLAILDVAIPGDGLELFSQGGKRWHHGFHQVADMPEALIRGREEIYLGWFYDSFGHKPGVISEDEVAEYLRTYRQPEAFRAGLEYYRALPQDIADNEREIARGPLDMPVLALGGADGRGRGMDVVRSLRKVASNVSGGVIEQCGHWMAEEQPEELARHLGAFFGRA